MSKKKHISAVISLKDNFSAGLRGIRREQNSFRKEVAQTRKAMDSINKKKMTARLNATQAHKAFNQLKKDTRYIEAKKKLVQAVALKDMATAKLKKIQSNMKSLGKAVAKPIIMAKDKATSIIKGLSSKLITLAKGISIPIAATIATGTSLFNSGANLEQQQVSMRHFMGIGNKGKSNKELDAMTASYIKDLRNNANTTPFETSEVLQAGTRALGIAKGNTKEAMGLVALAEDMAALTYGKSINDAMEALADAEMGEYARLTEFNIKATKENGDTPQSVKKQLEEMYAGGSEKLSGTSKGLFSTIKGTLTGVWADAGLKTNEKIKPVMQEIVKGIESMQPTFEAIQVGIANGVGGAITWIKEQLPTIAPFFQTAFDTAKGIVSTAAPVIGQLITALGPVFSGLLSVAQVVMQGIGTAVQVAAPIVSGLISALSPVFSSVGSALKSLGTIFNSVFKGIMNTVEKAYNFVKPLIDGIGKAVSGISGAVSSGLNWVAGKIGKNATGTRYWRGGLSLVGEAGPELVQMPRGSKVYTNTETKSMMKSEPTRHNGTEIKNDNYSITINMNGVTIREEADVDRLAKEFIQKLQKTRINYRGAY